jgi:hypothetical protein
VEVVHNPPLVDHTLSRTVAVQSSPELGVPDLCRTFGRAGAAVAVDLKRQNQDQ